MSLALWPTAKPLARGRLVCVSTSISEVRLYLQTQQQQLPVNKGPTAVPTAAVVLALFASVTLVSVTVGQQVDTQVVGWQDVHSLVCEALGIPCSWYEPPSREKGSWEGDTP